MTNNETPQRAGKRGWGAAESRNKPDKIVTNTCVSPQLAPPYLSAANRKLMAGTEDYHKRK